MTWSTNSDREPKSEAGRRLVAELIIGPPKPTDRYSEAQLQAQGIIGLYLPAEAPEIMTGIGRFFQA